MSNVPIFYKSLKGGFTSAPPVQNFQWKKHVPCTLYVEKHLLYSILLHLSKWLNIYALNFIGYKIIIIMLF